MAMGEGEQSLTPADTQQEPLKRLSPAQDHPFTMVYDACRGRKDNQCAAQEDRPGGAPPDANSDEFRHGFGVGGSPLTWTGRVVSLSAWRQLTEWEKHGPDGRVLNGKTKRWGWHDE